MPNTLPKVTDAPGLSSNVPYSFAEPLTPGLTASATLHGIYVGGLGDLSVVMAGNGSTAIFKAVPIGTVLPIRITMVNTTGTTATELVGLY